MTKINVTKELVTAITKAVRTWKSDTVPLDDADQHFDTFCEEEYGLKVDFVAIDKNVHIVGAEMLDEEKYINFLLRFGNMHNE